MIKHSNDILHCSNTKLTCDEKHEKSERHKNTKDANDHSKRYLQKAMSGIFEFLDRPLFASFVKDDFLFHFDERALGVSVFLDGHVARPFPLVLVDLAR